MIGSQVILVRIRWAMFIVAAFFWNLTLSLSPWVPQVIVSGKLRAQRAKSMKFKDGYMISSGGPTTLYIDSAVRHVLLRQVRELDRIFHRGLNQDDLITTSNSADLMR